jgi:hypothetical protein
VDSEEFVIGLCHQEVTFLVDIIMSTTSETSDVGIIEDGTGLEDDWCRVGWEFLANTSDFTSASLEYYVETGGTLLWSSYDDWWCTLMASLQEFLV